jgi:hypothetical protein
MQKSIPFKTVAGACAQMFTSKGKWNVSPIQGLFRNAPDEQPQMIRFFHGNDERLNNKIKEEDLHEIFYILTDMYADEVVDEPDIIQILADFSEVDEMDYDPMTFSYVYDKIKRILNTNSNRERAIILRPLLNRLTRYEMYWLLVMMKRGVGNIRRRTIIHALAYVHKMPPDRINRAAQLIPLHEVATHLLASNDLPSCPTIGDKMLIHLPPTWDDTSLPFSMCFFELIRGERLTLHVHNDFTKLYDPNGMDIEDEGEDLTQLLSFLPKGIYMIERVSQDDLPVKVVDVLFTPDGLHDLPFYKRREWLFKNCHKMFIKDIDRVENMAQMKAKLTKKALCFLHNGRTKVHYTNSKMTTVRYSMTYTGEIFRLTAGVWVRDEMRGLVMNRWRVSARDGIDGYYEVGIIHSENYLEKHLKSYTDPDVKAVEGNEAAVTSPVFVEVKVQFADYDDRGIIIQGHIIALAPKAGISDVIPVDEIEWLMGDEE